MMNEDLGISAYVKMAEKIYHWPAGNLVGRLNCSNLSNYEFL